MYFRAFRGDEVSPHQEVTPDFGLCQSGMEFLAAWQCRERLTCGEHRGERCALGTRRKNQVGLLEGRVPF